MTPAISFPCMAPVLVSAEDVVANDYNPNNVASPEMQLLKHSILEDGVTQPIVVVYDSELCKYVVVDGFHRYTVLTRMLGCTEIPVVVLQRTMTERMAATVRHNRARGKHQVDLMAVLMDRLLKLGWSDHDIAKHLGMEAEEVIRLKQQTGLAGLFKGQPYSRSWIRDESETA